METITRKEAFECAVAQMIAISQVVNKGKEKLYDYALCLQKGSLDPIVSMKPGESFKWKNIEPGKYGQTSYAFVPINPYGDLLLRESGLNDDSEIIVEKFSAYSHPAPWIKLVLSKQYMKLSYQMGNYLWGTNLEFDSSFFSSTHSTWIRLRFKDDGMTYYYPYYEPSKRKKLFSSIPQKTLEQIYDECWDE